jgi:hypothetical protein
MDLVCGVDLGYFILHLGKRKPLQVVAVWLGGVRGEKGMYEDVGASALGR